MGLSRLLSAALSGLLVLPVMAAANPFETRLPNGLKLIVKEDRRAPTVTQMVWYRVGALDEAPGHGGLAHALEHMMFRGTETLGPGEFDRRVAEVGGSSNAFTTQDYTAYFELVPREALAAMMQLEADRMATLRIDDALFAKELEVIREERRLRTDDQPRARLGERLMAAAWGEHPYARPVIGSPADLARMEAQDLRDGYARWYGPENATLVIVGDVAHEAVFKLAQEIYGPLPARGAPPRQDAAAPARPGIRRLSLAAPAELPVLTLAWRVPALQEAAGRTPEARQALALEVLAAVLDGYDGARLGRRLVRGRGLAHSASAGYDAFARAGQSLFVLEGSPSRGHSLGALEAALRAEVRRIASAGVSTQELDRVKAQLISSRVFSRDSNMGQAMEIGSLEMAGLSWRDADLLADALRSVSAGEVRAAARSLLRNQALTVASLIPSRTPRQNPGRTPPQ